MKTAEPMTGDVKESTEGAATKTAESAVPRHWQTDLNEHFDYFRAPAAAQKERLSPEATLTAQLPPKSAEAEAVAAKRNELATAKKKLPGITDEYLLTILNKQIKELEDYLERVQADSHAEVNTVRDKTVLVKVHAELEARHSEWESKVAKRAAKAKEVKAAFQAKIAEERAKLMQLEEQFRSLSDEVLKGWDERNEDIRKHQKQVLEVAERRIAALTAPTEPTTTGTETAGTGSQQLQQQQQQDNQQLAAAAAAAAAGDPTAILLLTQLEHRVDINVSELRDLSLVQLQEPELPHLAHLYSWSNALLLEDAAALVTFQQSGVPIQTMYDLIGDTVWRAVFPGKVSDTDVIPVQLRQLMSYQMQTVSQRLQEQQYESARKAGEEAMKTAAQTVRAETSRVKKVKLTAKAGLVKK